MKDFCRNRQFRCVSHGVLMNPIVRGVVVRIGIAAGVGLGPANSLVAVEEERPPIFAARRAVEVEADAVGRRVPLLSATAKRRITEQVLSDARVREETARIAGAAAEQAATDLNAEGDVVVLERYVVRELRSPALAAPKNRALEMIRTGRLFTSADGRTTIDLLGLSVWNSSVGDTGDAKLTLKFTFRW